jgi:hypothetical protein
MLCQPCAHPAIDSNGDSNRISSAPLRTSQRLALLVQGDVRVDRHRDLDGRMADDLANHVRRCSKIEKKRHTSMAKIMESDRAESTTPPRSAG